MDKSSICLVIPPSPFLLDQRVFTSLGALSVAASLEERGVAVEVLDLSGCANYLDVVREYLQTSTATHIGITATTPQFPAAVCIADLVDMLRPEIRIILGGPHPTLVVAAKKQEECRRVRGRAHAAFFQLLKCFDVIVSGDGERAVFGAMKPDAPNLIDADERGSPLRLTNDDLNRLPLPARHLIDLKSYHYQIEGVPATSLITQLGCPFGCAFCGGRASPMLRHVRRRSVDSVVAEMRFLFERYGYRGFMLYDDELNPHNGFMLELMRRIAEEQRKFGVEWRLRGFVKAELFTDEQAAAMYAAGFRWLLTGIESGSPRMLTNMNKRVTREQNARCVEIAHTHGFKVKALMSIGHAGESRETVAETGEWLERTLLPTDDFDVTIITPYPGSPYYDDAVFDGETGEWVYRCANGDELRQTPIDYSTTADYYKGDPNGGYVSYVRTQRLSAVELIQERDALEFRVRTRLGIPFPSQSAAIHFEHSMGQGSSLPPSLLRISKNAFAQQARCA